MNFKYLVSSILVSSIALGTGFFIFTEASTADVVVEWQEGDNSSNIQKAIDSGDDTVIIPKMNEPWVVGKRIRARQPNQKIVFEPGVLVLAQKGAFQKINDSIMLIEADNVTLSGYKATFQMQKADYLNPELYEPSEFRHNIVVRGAKNFVVEGLTLKDAGGDGLFVSHGPKAQGESIPQQRFSSGVIRDVVADNNHRLGLSIMSAQDLTVENSIFKNTSGTKPASGVDIEPDHEWQKLVNIKFKNNQFIDNDRNGIQIGLGKYRGENITDVSISFDGCEVMRNKESGIKINTNKAGAVDGVRGKISFKDCDIDTSGISGIHIKSDRVNLDEAVKIDFENITVRNTGNESPESAPVVLFNTHAPGVVANIDFGKNFVIYDDAKRPGLLTSNFSRKHGLANIHGQVKINNPNQQPSFLSDNLENVTLEIIK
ncbi:right-handed parallel beta-helix repeat-containing protein [Waterburya agarophytonicola K14]|uniref:Right-handed parallel beta-helix repeat-containing protein n=1 Tax=Waterburya agarophytonicola KI4 TaxID=2874699 RepID=A0A964BS18_9CYAN|nr:right-handed parallel beta-helix repeat-containing protein [Waterburya agarophytonicola]MCC0177473.1 right-handed parallel beta-helix repeat-containing protein [Waterburya agarophytonicola KI4]